MIRIKTINEERAIYADYDFGNAQTVRIDFSFRFPASLPQHLTPMLTTVSAYDSAYNRIAHIDNGNVDVPWSDVELGKPGEIKFYLLYQTNFLIADGSDREAIEEFLKSCTTRYRIDGGADGQKAFSLYDTVTLSADGTEAFMFKQVNLKR